MAYNLFSCEFLSFRELPECYWLLTGEGGRKRVEAKIDCVQSSKLETAQEGTQRTVVVFDPSKNSRKPLLEGRKRKGKQAQRKANAKESEQAIANQFTVHERQKIAKVSEQTNEIQRKEEGDGG